MCTWMILIASGARRTIYITLSRSRLAKSCNRRRMNIRSDHTKWDASRSPSHPERLHRKRNSKIRSYIVPGWTLFGSGFVREIWRCTYLKQTPTAWMTTFSPVGGSLFFTYDRGHQLE